MEAEVEQFLMVLLDMALDSSLMDNCIDDDEHYYLKAVKLWTHHNHYSTPKQKN